MVEASVHLSIFFWGFEPLNDLMHEVLIIIIGVFYSLCNLFFCKIFITHKACKVSYCSICLKNLFCDWTCLIHFFDKNLFISILFPSEESISQVCIIKFIYYLFDMSCIIMFCFYYFFVSTEVFSHSLFMLLSKYTNNIQNTFPLKISCCQIFGNTKAFNIIK